MKRNTRKILSLIIFLVTLIIVPTYYFIIYPKYNSTDLPTKIKSNDSWDEEEYIKFQSLGLTKSKEFLISTSDKRASEIGAQILEKGGNVIDGIIAAQMVLNVVEPQASGIGGGAFLLYWDAKSKKTYYFNGREIAPANAHSQMFLNENKEPKDFHDAVKGGLSVGTPGLLKMLKLVHDKFGQMPWEELFDGAIAIARDGFVVDKKIYDVGLDLSYLKDFDQFSKIYLKDNGKPKDIGSIIRNPDLADTFETIAKRGVDPFYLGRIASNIVKKVQNSKINPGYLSLSDLANYKAKEDNLICGPYRKFKICSVPIPSSGGITLLQILGILENFDLNYYSPSSPQAIHLISEATKLAYLDRNKYIGDVEGVPIKQMLDKKYLKSRSQLINMDKALKLDEINPGIFDEVTSYLINPNTLENPSTTHLSAVDKEGNAIAMTSSIEYLFGSALIVDGFALNNQLTDFSFIDQIDGKDVANKLVPGKQPRSSMTPTFVFDEDDNLILIVGSPGGQRIIQYVLKTIIAYLDWNLNVSRAIALPNFVALGDVIEIEKGTDLEKVLSKLMDLGHKIEIKNIVSGINAINIDTKNSYLIGGADFRRNGAAIGK